MCLKIGGKDINLLEQGSAQMLWEISHENFSVLNQLVECLF